MQPYTLPGRATEGISTPNTCTCRKIDERPAGTNTIIEWDDGETNKGQTRIDENQNSKVQNSKNRDLSGTKQV